MDERARVQIAPDAPAAGRLAAERIAEASRIAIASRGRFAIAVSGGETPILCYDALAAPPLRESVAWDRWELFFADERCVAPEDAASNFRLVRDHLLSRVPVAPAGVHRWPTERGAGPAADAYDRDLGRVLGDPPVFDLVQLGVGTDGHTASLFPGTAAALERGRRTAVGRAPAPPRERLTLTLPVLESAREILLLAVGQEKAEIVRRALQDGDPALPAARIGASRRAVWVLDAAAARRLPDDLRAGSARS